METQTQTQPKVKRFWTPRTVARIAILIALSAVGAFIKIPSPTGSVALDSAPGFFAAGAFGPVIGGIVISIGHLFSSGTTGFPLSLPVHIYIAGQMFLWAVVFWLLASKVNVWLGVVVATICNGVVSALLMIPVGGMGMFTGFVGFLTIGAAVNLIIAGLAYTIVKRSNFI